MNGAVTDGDATNELLTPVFIKNCDNVFGRHLNWSIALKISNVCISTML